MKRFLTSFLAVLCLAAPALAQWDDSQPAAEFVGGAVTVGQVRRLCSDVEAMTGEVASETRLELLEALVEQAIVEMKQREYGAYELDEEYMVELRRLADCRYAAMSEEYGADYLAAQGVSADWIYGELIAQARQNALRDAVTGDIVIADNQMRAQYEIRAAAQEAEFGLDPVSYDRALMDGDMIFYSPPGYRRVEAILIAFDEGAQVEYDALKLEMDGTGDANRIQDMLTAMDKLYAVPLRTAEKLIRRLNAGENFSEIQAAYSEDAASEYLVGPGSAQYGDAFLEVALALEEPGDVSGAVYSDWGIYILRYADDVESGRVEYADVEAALRETLETEARNAAYSAIVEKWLDEAEIAYYPDRI